ncbi:hypothetical protein NP233_g5904 [Leucocoprinus birnbaumii]|uniref:F-box domain-containing protein n=1 Tax=Leucocoprinus birnbaumii TaxID=56174 RepID=A0AAD5VUN8_9AGAR|nr:hypothetical protein NP233_g5904 [Leucocoprinus birnbaumii]
MRSFLDLPLDVLTEILAYLPASGIISSRQVCSSLNKLSNTRFLWLAVFKQTEGMLRTPMLDVKQMPLLELEKIMVRAEKLEGMWASVSNTAIIPRRVYQMEHNLEVNQFPIAIIGDYVLFSKYFTGGCLFSLFPLSNKSIGLGSTAAFEHKIQTVEPDLAGQLLCATHMSCISNSFYIATAPRRLPEGREHTLKLVEIGIGPNGPGLITECQVAFAAGKPADWSKFALYLNDLYAYALPNDMRGDIEVHVCEIRTGNVFAVTLVKPPWTDQRQFPFPPISLYISDNLMIVPNGSVFTVYDSWKAQPMRTRLDPAFTCTSPLVRTRYIMMHIPSSGASITALALTEPDANSTTNCSSKVHVLSIENFGSGWCIREIDSVEVPGGPTNSSSRSSVLMRASLLKERYALGMLSIDEWIREVDSGIIQGFRNRSYAIWLDLSDPPRNAAGGFLRVTQIPSVPIFGEQDYFNYVSFDALSGRALLNFYPGYLRGVLGTPPSVTVALVLDFSGI